jgi:peptidoglycan hydrolase-like protein with peptidoglycan-binding domain
MKVIKLTESDLEKIVKKVLDEQIAQPTIKKGQQGASVQQVQMALKFLGYDLGNSGPNGDGIDGEFGNITKRALAKFQNKNQLPSTGKLDQMTRNTLFRGVPQINNMYSTDTFLDSFRKPKTNASVTKKQEVTKAALSPQAIKQKEKIVAKKIVGTEAVLNPDASLLFNGDQLQWISGGAVVKTWNAISGLTFKNTPPSNWGELLKRYTQSPETWAKDKNAGPLPPGTYSVGPIQSRNSGTQDVGILDSLITLWQTITGTGASEKDKAFQANTDYSRIAWGNFRAPIIPTKGTNTYGRSSFFIHGGTFAGSHGCIDLTDEMGDFAKFYGTWAASTKKKSIPLTVNYKSPSQNNFFTKLWDTLTK